jgi:general secretion pathway protein D
MAAGSTNFVSAQDENAPADPPEGSNEIRLNFRGVPLDTVLDYLSQSAGYIIIKETDFNGRVDAWSFQPLTKDEAYEVLNTILNQKGYAAVRSGKTLTIVNRDDAKMRDLPVKTGNEPSEIPKSDEMINQIIPVRYANAVQLIVNLEPLKPSYATMTANESSNAIVYTDTQTNVRRMVEIIRALDTSISSISSVRVFPLRYSDAKELAETIKELFTIEDQSNNNRGGRGGFPGFGGFGRGGRGGPGGEEAPEGADSAAMQAVSRIVAVADERSNSLIVSAADELMPLIEKVVNEVDTTIDDITELRVFKLENADASEMSELITELFSDDTQTQTPQFGFGRFGGFGGGPGGRGGGNNNNTANNQSDRQLQQTTVTCVPDARTNSIVVTAARETMVQIEQMVDRLDENTDKKQNVRVIRLQYADVDNVANILRSIFIDQVSGNSQTNNQNTNQNTLRNRTVEDTGFSTSTTNN